MADVQHRIVFVPRLREADFLALTAAADVMLATVHFNGMNTSLEAFAVGTPVVTLPSALQRGRHTQAMYRRMGLEDLVATDATAYVEAFDAAVMNRRFREVLFLENVSEAGLAAKIEDPLQGWRAEVGID